LKALVPPQPVEGEEGHARARAREVDKLVLEIVQMMLVGEWVAGASHRAFADRERVTLATVERWASEAGRMLRIAPDVERHAAINIARLDAAHALARRTNDVKGAVAAIAEQNKMIGAHAPEKHAHRVHIAVEAFAKLSPAEMLLKVREQLRDLGALEKQLEEQVEGRRDST
jgi:hypothetical protein